MARVSIIFKEAHRKEVIAGSKLIGGHDLPDSYTGPVFEFASIEPSGLDGMVLVKPDDVDTAYIYNQSDIARIKVERAAERVTESGIVLVKPTLVVPKK